MDILHSILMILIPVLGPVLTEGVHALLQTVINKTPFWLKPFLPLVMGNVTSAIVAATGVGLPMGLDHISNDQVTQILGSGFTLGLISMGIHDIVDGLKRTFPPDTVAGKILNAIAGSHTESQLGPRAMMQKPG